jgi:hypothetical protein
MAHVKTNAATKSARVTVHRVRERPTAQLVDCPVCNELLQIQSTGGGHVAVGTRFRCGGCGVGLCLLDEGKAVEVLL